MARFFVLSLLMLPIVEIALFIKVGQSIGVMPTLALVILTAVLGSLLLRTQGLQIVGQLRNNMSSGQLPGRAIADAMMISLAALLLILPGFLTDGVALALLLSPVRSWIYAGLASRLSVVGASASGGYRGPRQPDDPRVGARDTIDLDEDDYRPQ
ncbi:MAG: FxsA family protein [Devosia sp.]